MSYDDVENVFDEMLSSCFLVISISERFAAFVCWLARSITPCAQFHLSLLLPLLSISMNERAGARLFQSSR